jgi:hypothetical protein
MRILGLMRILLLILVHHFLLASVSIKILNTITTLSNSFSQRLSFRANRLLESEEPKHKKQI